MHGREIDRALVSALPDGVRGIDALIAKLDRMPETDARELGRALVDRYLRGKLVGHAWTALTGLEDSSPREIARTMRRVWDALAKNPRGYADVWLETDIVSEHDPLSVVRWAWSPRLVLMSQDEDLLLFEQWKAELLLEEVRARCPKRSYAARIVEHGARDRANGAVGSGHHVEETLGGAARLAVLARDAKLADLAAYLERLASYSRVGPVDREGAIDRGVDLARCAPAPREQVTATRVGEEWMVPVEVAGHVLHVHAKTGAMRGVPRS